MAEPLPAPATPDVVVVKEEPTEVTPKDRVYNVLSAYAATQQPLLDQEMFLDTTLPSALASSWPTIADLEAGRVVSPGTILNPIMWTPGSEERQKLRSALVAVLWEKSDDNKTFTAAVKCLGNLIYDSAVLGNKFNAQLKGMLADDATETSRELCKFLRDKLRETHERQTPRMTVDQRRNYVCVDIAMACLSLALDGPPHSTVANLQRKVATSVSKLAAK